MNWGWAFCQKYETTVYVCSNIYPKLDILLFFILPGAWLLTLNQSSSQSDRLFSFPGDHEADKSSLPFRWGAIWWTALLTSVSLYVLSLYLSLSSPLSSPHPPAPPRRLSKQYIHSAGLIHRVSASLLPPLVILTVKFGKSIKALAGLEIKKKLKKTF